MTLDNPTERPTAHKVVDVLFSILPELHSETATIPYWTCLDENCITTYEQVTSPNERFHKISPQRLAPLAHLTLINVKLSTEELFNDVLKFCPLLQFLHVRVLYFTDEGISTNYKQPNLFLLEDIQIFKMATCLHWRH